ncbi:hypothetical protein SK128_013498 [Halocaridina rubra]|uniref:Uncharacterized protein n=1 Tax=Halocaridina rubra TaxID=373956 RepID=A0AAN8XJ82_HALRR
MARGHRNCHSYWKQNQVSLQTAKASVESARRQRGADIRVSRWASRCNTKTS